MFSLNFIKESLVKIKDETPYNDLWQTFDTREKAGFTLKNFDFHYDGMIEVQVDGFWEYMKKLNSPNL